VVDEAETVVVNAAPFAEDAAGYQKLFELLGRARPRTGGAKRELSTASARPPSVLGDGGDSLSMT